MQCLYLKTRRRRGFSLLELTLVIAIIAVLGVIAVPRFANAAARQRLEAAALRIDADLHYAQTRARSKSNDCTARFAGDNTLALIDSDNTTVTTTNYQATPYEVQVSVTLDNAGTDLTFNGFGRPDTGGTITLTGGGGQIILDIDSVTGEVTRQ